MDPQVCLYEAEEALKANKIGEADRFLTEYRNWRRLNGFEPEGGDATAERLSSLLAEKACKILSDANLGDIHNRYKTGGGMITVEIARLFNDNTWDTWITKVPSTLLNDEAIIDWLGENHDGEFTPELVLMCVYSKSLRDEGDEG